MTKTVQELVALGFKLSGSPLPDLQVLVAPDGTQMTVVDGVVSDEAFTEYQNRASQRDKLVQAVNYFSGNYQNWATMTAAQKDAANRQAQRALANIARYLLNDLSSAGD